MTAFNTNPLSRFGCQHDRDLPWNRSALVWVERLNGRRQLGDFVAAIAGATDHRQGLGRFNWRLNAPGCSAEPRP